MYSACVIDTKDSRKTRLITLLLDWEHEEEVKEFGCNITGFRAGLEVYAVTWKLKVKKISKSNVGLIGSIFYFYFFSL